MLYAVQYVHVPVPADSPTVVRGSGSPVHARVLVGTSSLSTEMATKQSRRLPPLPSFVLPSYHLQTRVAGQWTSRMRRGQASRKIQSCPMELVLKIPATHAASDKCGSPTLFVSAIVINGAWVRCCSFAGQDSAMLNSCLVQSGALVLAEECSSLRLLCVQVDGGSVPGNAARDGGEQWGEQWGARWGGGHL